MHDAVSLKTHAACANFRGRSDSDIPRAATSKRRKERTLTNIYPSGLKDNPIQEPARPSIGLWSNRPFGRYAAETRIHGQTLRGPTAQVRRQDVCADHADPCRKDQ